MPLTFKTGSLGYQMASNTFLNPPPVVSLVMNSVTYNNSAVTGGAILSTANNGYITGTATSNSQTYSVHAFGLSQYQYKVNYTCSVPTTMYILCVGGGGGGSVGGGGAGGMFCGTRTIPVGSDTITINVGAGGTGGVATSSTTSGPAGKGGDSSLIWTTNTNLNSYGGGGGGSSGSSTAGTAPSINGGSGGGGITTGGAYIANRSNNNYAHNGYAASTTQLSNGGGGAVGTGGEGNSGGGTAPGIAGNGLKLPATIYGIYDFSPANYNVFSNYYWAGAGSSGGIANDGRVGLPGKGGGGGGWSNNGDANGISTGTVGTATSGGPGGPNTGGGGGGGNGWGNNYSGGAGGSGIVVFAFTSSITQPSTMPTPVQWFKFNSGDIVGTTIYNYATSTYNGTIGNSTGNGGTIITSIKTGSCTGSFNYNPATKTTTAAYPYFPSFTPSAVGCTFSVWMYAVSLGEGFSQAFQLSNAFANLISIQLSSNTTIYLNIGTGVTNTAVTVPTLASTWSHFVMSLLPSGYFVYLNGSEIAAYSPSTTDYSTNIYNTARANVMLGRTSQNGSTYDSINFCDFRAYNVPLTVQQVSTLYSNGAGN